MNKQVIKSYDLPNLERAVQLLQKDVARPFTISSLALEVGINTSKLTSGFKQLYNQTIYQFRLSLRLKLAQQLLEDTDLSVKQIAYKTGFDSRDSLTRCFKKKLKRSPREWKNSQCMHPDLETNIPGIFMAASGSN